MATPTSRQRKPNFSHEESSKLLEMIVIHYNVITQPGNNLEANKSKKASWDVISQEVSQVAQVLRDDKECRKKWRDLKQTVNNYDSTYGKGAKDGPNQPKPPFYDWIVSIQDGCHSGILEEVTSRIPNAWADASFEKPDIKPEIDVIVDHHGHFETSSPNRTQEDPKDDRTALEGCSAADELAQVHELYSEAIDPLRADSLPVTSGGDDPSRLTNAVSKSSKMSKARGKKRAVKQTNAGNPKLWDEWLQVQIDYYKSKSEKLKAEQTQSEEFFKLKSELLREQLLQLRDKRNDRSNFQM